MRRREFVTVLGSAFAIWPLAAVAQQQSRMRRIGVLMGFKDDAPQTKRYLAAFQEALASLGWVREQTIQIEYRAASDLDGLRSGAVELLNYEPDLMVTESTPATNTARQVSPNMRIVFVSVSDPIGPGFVKSLARPGGSITGFTNFEEAIGGKWLELLREISPSIRRASMLFNPETANSGASGGIYLRSIETAARNTGTELSVSAVHDPAGIDEVFTAMAQGSSGGVLVMPNAFTNANRERIVAQAEQHRVPTIYPDAQFVTAGGLLSYGVNTLDQFRGAATYADRILKGANPADLPVQQPTKFELAINRKTADALRVSVPPDLLVAADKVIE